MTLADSMALAVLRGDRVAAYALADLLQEERSGRLAPAAQAAAALEARSHPPAGDGYAVYQWPEFREFCRRAGILWDLRSVSITFTVEEGKPLLVSHKYIGTDAGERHG